MPHPFSFCNQSFIFSWSFLLDQPFRHGLRVANWAEVARCKLRNVHDVEQTENMVSFFTSETAFRQDVGELVFGINILALDFVVQVDSVK